MLTNNASFFLLEFRQFFKRYYTVMCLKHLIFSSPYTQPSAILSAIQALFARRALHQGCQV
jgi:hypothetical protein